MSEHNQSAQHRECQELLPWFITGRLSEPQAARIELHLTDCDECKAEMDEQVELRAHMRREDPVAYAPQGSLQKLAARIDNDGSRTAVASPSERLANRQSAGQARAVRLLIAAAIVETIALALLVSAGKVTWFSKDTAAHYVTLTSSPPVTANGPVIRAVFDPGTSLAELSQAIRSIDAQIVAGPSDADVYTLTLKHGAETDTMNVAIEKLRSDQHVRFAEPAVSDFKGQH